MRRVLGIRVEPSAVHWAVVEGEPACPTLLASGSAKAPVKFNEAQALSWYRARVLHILELNNPQWVGVRYPEPKGKFLGDAMRRRARIEGVVLEAAESKGVHVLTGALVTISASLGVKAAKSLLEDEDLRGLDWSAYTSHVREAILVAVAALGA